MKKHINLDAIGGKLTKEEMKKVMGGSSNTGCYGECPGGMNTCGSGCRCSSAAPGMPSFCNR